MRPPKYFLISLNRAGIYNKIYKRVFLDKLFQYKNKRYTLKAVILWCISKEMKIGSTAMMKKQILCRTNAENIIDIAVTMRTATFLFYLPGFLFFFFFFFEHFFLFLKFLSKRNEFRNQIAKKEFWGITFNMKQC